jgi:pyruvate kinase
VHAGDTLLLDDGLVALSVTEVAEGQVHTEVLTDGWLSDRKGLNRLGGGLSLGALSEQDKEHIVIAAQLGVDFIAVSFCRSAADMNEARALARAAGSDAALVAKIERAEAIENLVEITLASEVVMVARGDLGVEIGDAELPGLQKKIIRTALEHNRVVITATQMLQSMVENPIPTRAEVLDVANAVIDGTDAVMLSAETASGNYPVKAVEAMARICLAPNASSSRHRLRGGAAQPRARRPGDRDGRHVPGRAHQGARDDRADRIRRHRALPVALPFRGADLRLVQARRRAPAHGDDARRVPDRLRQPRPAHARGRARRDPPAVRARPAGRDDRVLITSGDHMEVHGTTNTLRLLQVGAGGVAAGLGEL